MFFFASFDTIIGTDPENIEAVVPLAVFGDSLNSSGTPESTI